MRIGMEGILQIIAVFFIIYLLIYATYLFLAVSLGAVRLYQRDRMLKIRNELKHDYYFPVSILMPAYNEEVTIIDSVHSLLRLNYRLYEIIVIDDGSKDGTSQVLIDHFGMLKIDRPIHRRIPCQPLTEVYETTENGVSLTLIRKENGGKGDALNMGINASQYPYFLCIDADSMLQRDSLERIVQPVLEDDSIVAVGGLIRVAQCVTLKDGNVSEYHLPWNPITATQVMEYDRSFLASRILMDHFNGNLIISGAFGLFRKDVVIAAGGYNPDTLGEDMDLVIRLHVFCRNNNWKYSIRYEPNAVCWSQAPSSPGDLIKQRRRWHLGLFQCMAKYRQLFFNVRYGLVSFISYLYYLVYELLSPVVEVAGILVTVAAGIFGLLNFNFMVRFLLFYAFYGAALTITAFFQRIYTQGLKLHRMDVIKAVVMCVLEAVSFRYIQAFVRTTSFIGYRRKKHQWGDIKRVQQNNAEILNKQ